MVNYSLAAKYEEKDNYEAGTTFRNILSQHSKIICFVQKSNDMDTCASAVALGKIIKHLYPHTWYRIAGLKIESTNLKESEKWAITKEETEELQSKENQNILGILVDIPSESQVADPKLLKYCSELTIIDHHQERYESWNDHIRKKTNYHISEPEAASCSEIIWELVHHFKIYNDKKATKEIGEILFKGIFSDNQDFISSRTNSHTFQAIGEIASCGVDVPKLIRQSRRQSFRFAKLYAEIISTAVKEKNLLVMNLNIETVLKVMPELTKRDKKTGRIRQKRTFLFPLNHARNTIKANTFIFVHYSLFEPQNSIRRLVYIVLDKENKDLELLLEKHNFKNQRNRWFKEMKFSELCALLDENKDIFTR